MLQYALLIWLIESYQYQMLFGKIVLSIQMLDVIINLWFYMIYVYQYKKYNKGQPRGGYLSRSSVM